MDFLATRTRRKLLFAALYLSEGAPIGFIWLALPTQLRAADVPVEQITLMTGTLVWPWMLKFIWAPLVDVLRGPRWSYKHWIISAQILMGAALIPLFQLELKEDLSVIFALLMVHAVAAATQDAAIDALCIARVAAEERGSINGWMQAGQLLGRACMGGGSVMLAVYAGQAFVIAVLLGMIWFSTLLVLFTRDEATERTASARDAITSFLRTLILALGQRNTWIGLLFAGVAGAAYEGTGVIAGPLLIDHGLNQESVGYFLAVPAIYSMIAGSLLGGRLSDRVDRRWAVAFALVWIVASVMLIAVAHWAPSGPRLTIERFTLMLAGLAAMYLGIGLFTAASYALFMDITSPAVGATQFSAFMGATNGCESWSSYTVGSLIKSRGYPIALMTLCAASLAALPLLLILRLKRRDT